MSAHVVLSQKSRPYKIEVYGLQDNYIGTLQSYNDSFIGQIIEPEITISDDGSQSFICSIPKFYINPENNQKIDNPRWFDINNGVLAENTRILKVFLEYENETKVYPFIVDKIIDKRDSHFSVYKSIEATGLAFAELGKVGYKLELNSHTIESDYEKDQNIVANIDYWLDKVFPNIKNEKGEIIKWLTPWSYEIRMDWRAYSNNDRLSTKIYEDDYVSGWEIIDGTQNTAGKLVPTGIESGIEKARYIDCKNSNKYNITQTIAETFEVFCIYEYKCNQTGSFVHEYKENGKVYTGRKVIFYNRAIKTDNPVIFDYQKNLQTFSRTKDTSEVYTKLYITPIESEYMTNGYVTIADSEANPLLEDYILNFDYLYSIGSITDYQKTKIDEFKIKTRKLNTNLQECGLNINDLTVRVNDLAAEISVIKKELSSAKEELLSYQKLRDNEVTNTPVIKDAANSYSIVLVPETETGLFIGNIRLYGVDASSVIGYTNHLYNDILFNNCVPTTSIKNLEELDSNYYILLDDYGFASKIYTKNDKIGTDGGIVYLSLSYSPKNYYVEICNALENQIKESENKLILFGDNKIALEKQLDDQILKQENLLSEKEKLNNNFELIMGPALREGYWTPESYEDIGNNYTWTNNENSSNQVEYIFDTENFIGEQLNYYYDNINQDIKKYYNYISISDEKINSIAVDTVVHLYRENYSYTTTAEMAKGNYYFSYNNKKYYFTISENIPENSELKIIIDTSLKPSLYYGEELISIKSDFLENAINLTNRFEFLGTTLNDYKLYNNAGYVFGFKKDYGDNEQSVLGETFILGQSKLGEPSYSVAPILMFNNTTIDYLAYTNYTIINASNEPIINGELSQNIEQYSLLYPRIVINANNVDYDSDLLVISNAETKLVKYEDYTITIRKGKPHFTLKITDVNTFAMAYNGNYTVQYRVSRANDTLYLDALQVAHDNAYPKYSYELSIANLPDEINTLELGQLIKINDFSLGARAVQGYISGIVYKLNEPKSDELIIQNYKTKFEDLFGSIAATNEAMKVNKHSYDIAAGGFTSNGTINGDILQTSINNNNISLNFSNTNVAINNSDGIILTNAKPYLNGVYGQVALLGGGIFMSSQVDATGSRVWSTGITPMGINASMLTVGQLDTNLIRVFAGDNVAFQWNAEGIFAYKQDNGSIDENTYVKYSDKGLQFVNKEKVAVDLGWKGLLISTQDGSTEIDGNNGLSVYYGEKNDTSSNYAIRIGRFISNDEYSYGMRLQKKLPDGNYEETLVTTEDGTLWLKDYIQVGEPIESSIATTIEEDGNAETNVIYAAGISGTIQNSNAVRFWAGSQYENRDSAPFRVLQDGSLFATKAFIDGDITATKVEAIEGTIGGWIINTDNLASPLNNNNQLFLSSTNEQGHAIWANLNNDNIPAFSIDYNGKITALEGSFANGRITFNSEGVSVNGIINATDGIIGKWTINELGLSKKISNNNENKIINIYDDNDRSVLFINEAGKLFANNAEINGKIISEEANISGKIIAKEGTVENLTVGTGESHIKIIGNNESAYIQSSNYLPGILGHGWKIDNHGFAEFNNVNVRGKISTAVFEKNKISAVAGQLYVGPTIILLEASNQVTTTNKITWNYSDELADSSGIEYGSTYYVILESSLEGRDENNSDYRAEGTLKYEANQLILTITESKNHLAAGSQIAPNATIVIKGEKGTDNETSYGVLISAKDKKCFIEAYNGASNNNTVVTRLGDLNDILDDNFGGSLSGYGLYASNAYLTGQLILPGAGMTNQSDIKYGDSLIRIWAGCNSDDDITQANFIVTENGYLYAKQGIFEGKVIAQEGEFTGLIKAAGILLDEKEDTIIPSDHFYVAYENYNNQNELILDPTTYILNIDKTGLSVWEGGLRAYSDKAQDTIYSYSMGDKSPLPYFYLVDDYNENVFHGRTVAYKNHIFQLAQSENTYIINSVLIDNGIWFNSQTLNTFSSKEQAEQQAFSWVREKGMGISCIGQNNEQVLSIKAPQLKLNNGENNDINLSLRGSITIEKNSDNGSIIIGDMKIVALKGTDVGINII